MKTVFCGQMFRHAMKPFPLVLTLLILVCTTTPTLPRGARYFPIPADDGRNAAEMARLRTAINHAFEQQAAADAAGRQRLAALAKEPWRVVEGVTNTIYDKGWFHFSGKVLNIEAKHVHVQGPPDSSAAGLSGICVDGSVSLLNDNVPFSLIFFVVNCPYTFADEDVIEDSLFYMAKAAGTVTVDSTAVYGPEARSTKLAKTITLHKFDYGQVISPPPEVVAAAAAKAAEAKRKAAAAVLKLDQEKAAEGSALYQFRLGRRYLAGNGVAMDPVKARELSEKSAAQGNEDAAAELKKLSSPQPPQTNSTPRGGEGT